MNTTVKLFFTVLVSIFLTACGSGDDNGSSTNSPNILSDYLSETFPPFDDTPYRDNITYSRRDVMFIQISSNDAESFYDTLINEKGFNADREFGDGDISLKPNLDDYQGFDSIQAYISNETGSVLGDYFIALSMGRQGGALSETDFDEVFGFDRTKGVPDHEEFIITYENVNMTAELNDYYEALISNGVFTEEECETDGQTDWNCYHAVSFSARKGLISYVWSSYYSDNNLYIYFSK
jgi:hypothetical protein